MEAILNNTVYNLPTIEDFYRLEESSVSNNYPKSTIKFMYNTFKHNTYFYFYENKPNKYYLMNTVVADKLNLIKKSFIEYKRLK